jgi:phosphatidylglycerophosphatase A
VVWDEFVGYWVTMIAAPAGWQWLVVGFVLFRFFDILKPWPISWCDKKLHGGFGIMLDDVIAGIFALVCMQLFYFYISG